MNLILIYSYLLPRQPDLLQFSNTDMSLLYPVQIWHVFTISGSNLHFNTRTDWLIGIVNLNTIDIFLESVWNKLPFFSFNSFIKQVFILFIPVDRNFDGGSEKPSCVFFVFKKCYFRLSFIFSIIAKTLYFTWVTF